MCAAASRWCAARRPGSAPRRVDALAAYRAVQARSAAECLLVVRRAVRNALTRAADWRAANWRGRLTGKAYRAVARETGLTEALRRYRRVQHAARP
jgi:hypothetical protein